MVTNIYERSQVYMHVAATPQPTLRARLPRTGYEAAYFESGAGTPVVFLHGFMGHKTSWLPLVERLRLHARCLSLDLVTFSPVNPVGSNGGFKKAS